jgi:hypothetical protein
VNEQTSSPCALRIPQFCTGIHFSCHCYNSKQQQQQQRNSQALTSLWSERRISSPRSHALWRIRDPHRHHFSRLRCNNMKIFCYNTHTQAKKKLDGKYLTQEYENPKGFSASNDGDKDCISAEREREGGRRRERERERESVRVCVGGGCRVFSLQQVSLTSANVLLGQSSTFFDNPLYRLHFTRPPSLRGRSATAAAAVRKNRFDPMLIYLEELFICCCLVDHSSRACVHACLLLLL